MTSGRARLVLVVIVLGVVSMGVFVWEPVYWWVMTKRVLHSYTFEHKGVTLEVRGWDTVKRWAPKARHGTTYYHAGTGYLYVEGTYDADRRVVFVGEAGGEVAGAVLFDVEDPVLGADVAAVVPLGIPVADRGRRDGGTETNDHCS